MDEKPFKAGEKLTYTVKFGPIIGGTASLVTQANPITTDIPFIIPLQKEKPLVLLKNSTVLKIFLKVISN